jgi:hypothetical protein
VADIVGKTEGLTSVKEYLIKETNIDTVLAEKMLYIKLPAEHLVLLPAGEAQGFTLYRPRRACCPIRPRKNNGPQDSPRAACPFGEGGFGREEPTGQPHTCLDGELVEEIRDFLER